MRKFARIAAALLVAVSAATPAAQAVDGAASYRLPQRWNDDYKPGTHCATPGAQGTYVTAERMWFKQTDAASVANRNDYTVPVSHTVTDKRTQTTEVSASVKPIGDIEKYMSNTFGFNFVHEIHWSLGQKIGPYDLEANQQGKLVWGFMMLDADSQDVRCSEEQQWVEKGAPYFVSAPYSRYSELRIDDAPVY